MSGAKYNNGKLVRASLKVGGVEHPVLALQERPTPYEWQGFYSSIPDSTWETMDADEMPKESWRILRWLWRAMDYNTNWARIQSYRRLGEDCASLTTGSTVMDASRVCNMIAWLEVHEYLLRVPGGRSLFLSPAKIFRGGGTAHIRAMDEWKRWRLARKKEIEGRAASSSGRGRGRSSQVRSSQTNHPARVIPITGTEGA